MTCSPLSSRFFAETLRCLKEHQTEPEAVLVIRAAREQEVTAAINKILTVRSGGAAPAAAASAADGGNGASRAASAAAVGAASSILPAPDSDDEAWEDAGQCAPPATSYDAVGEARGGEGAGSLDPDRKNAPGGSSDAVVDRPGTAAATTARRGRSPGVECAGAP